MRLVGPFPEDCWPTRAEGLLLRAALLPLVDARKAWEAWRDHASWPMSVGLARLLPAAFWNLREALPRDTWLDAAETEYLRSRYRNLLRFDEAASVLDALGRAKVEFMLLKGSALVAAHYADPGLRPMADLDLLVRPADRARAIEVLGEHGFSLSLDIEAASMSTAHSAPLVRSGASPLDLHWRSLDEGEDGEAIWEHTEEARLGGIGVRVPSRADLLLNACIQGLRWDWDAPQRWVLDAMAVLRSPGKPLDWPRLIERASDLRSTTSAHDALFFLRETFDARVPPEVLTTLAGSEVSRWERLASLSRRTRPDLRGPLLSSALRVDDYERQVRRGELKRGVFSLLKVWRVSWGLKHSWELPAHAAARGVRRMWQLVRHRGHR